MNIAITLLVLFYFNIVNSSDLEAIVPIPNDVQVQINQISLWNDQYNVQQSQQEIKRMGVSIPRKGEINPVIVPKITSLSDISRNLISDYNMGRSFSRLVAACTSGGKKVCAESIVFMSGFEMINRKARPAITKQMIGTLDVLLDNPVLKQIVKNKYGTTFSPNFYDFVLSTQGNYMKHSLTSSIASIPGIAVDLYRMVEIESSFQDCARRFGTDTACSPQQMRILEVERIYAIVTFTWGVATMTFGLVSIVGDLVLDISRTLVIGIVTIEDIKNSGAIISTSDEFMYHMTKLTSFGLQSSGLEIVYALTTNRNYVQNHMKQILEKDSSIVGIFFSFREKGVSCDVDMRTQDVHYISKAQPSSDSQTSFCPLKHYFPNPCLASRSVFSQCRLSRGDPAYRAYKLVDPGPGYFGNNCRGCGYIFNTTRANTGKTATYYVFMDGMELGNAYLQPQDNAKTRHFVVFGAANYSSVNLHFPVNASIQIIFPNYGNHDTLMHFSKGNKIVFQYQKLPVEHVVKISERGNLLEVGEGENLSSWLAVDLHETVASVTFVGKPYLPEIVDCKLKKYADTKLVNIVANGFEQVNPDQIFNCPVVEMYGAVTFTASSNGSYLLFPFNLNQKDMDHDYRILYHSGFVTVRMLDFSLFEQSCTVIGGKGFSKQDSKNFAMICNNFPLNSTFMLVFENFVINSTSFPISIEEANSTVSVILVNSTYIFRRTMSVIENCNVSYAKDLAGQFMNLRWQKYKHLITYVQFINCTVIIGSESNDMLVSQAGQTYIYGKHGSDLVEVAKSRNSSTVLLWSEKDWAQKTKVLFSNLTSAFLKRSVDDLIVEDIDFERKLIIQNYFIDKNKRSNVILLSPEHKMPFTVLNKKDGSCFLVPYFFYDQESENGYMVQFASLKLYNYGIMSAFKDELVSSKIGNSSLVYSKSNKPVQVLLHDFYLAESNISFRLSCEFYRADIFPIDRTYTLSSSD